MTEKEREELPTKVVELYRTLGVRPNKYVDGLISTDGTLTVTGGWACAAGVMLHGQSSNGRTTKDVMREVYGIDYYEFAFGFDCYDLFESGSARFENPDTALGREVRLATIEAGLWENKP